jgi:hypothetical protein
VLACLASCVNGNSLAEAQAEFEISLIHGGDNCVCRFKPL